MRTFLRGLIGDLLSTETSVASAATTDIGAASTRRVAITGTTAITSFGTAVNRERLIRFTGGLTLTHDATKLILPGAANIVTVAGDAAIATSDASGNWQVRQYQRAAASPVVVPGGAWTPYTPFVSSSTGKISTLGTVKGTYQITGKTLDVQCEVTITTNGSAGGYLNVGLPPGLLSFSNCSLSIIAVPTAARAATLFAGGSNIIVQTTTGTYPGGDGATFYISGRCQIQ